MTDWSLAHTISGEFFSELFENNVILAAKANRHRTRSFAGPLSIKGVVRGEAVWTVDGVRYPVDSTSCLIVNRKAPYDLDVEAAEPVHTFVVFFADPLISDVAHARSRSTGALLEDPVPGERRSLKVPHRLWTTGNGVHSALHELHECAGDELEQGEVDLHLRRALDSAVDARDQVDEEIQRIPAERRSTREELHKRVTRGQAHLNALLCEPFDLGATAREACLSPHHFHRMFRAVNGIAPFRYVSERRIEQAKRLLVEKDWDVVEIATAVGYHSLPSFTRQFKKRVGTTPAAFRTQLRNRG